MKNRTYPRLHYDHILSVSERVRNDLEVTRLAWEKSEGLLGTFSPMLAFFKHGAPPSLGVLIEALFWYEQYGQQNYVIGPQLQEMFSHTSLKGVPKDAIKLPYKSFYIACEGIEGRVWGGSRTKWHKLAGFYVTQHDDGKIFLYFWAKANENSFGPEDDATAWMKFDLDEIYEEGDIESYIENTTRHDLSHHDLPSMAPPEEHQEEVLHTYLIAARTAFNLVMYLQSVNREIEVETSEDREKTFRRKFGRKKNLNKGRAGKARRDLDRLGKATVTWIGDSIESRTPVPRLRGTTTRCWVTGHWQRYWVGKGPQKTQQWRYKLAFERNIAAAEGVERRYYRDRSDRPGDANR